MSIFFKYLPYWLDLVVRHSIDGMHIKNVFESDWAIDGHKGKDKRWTKVKGGLFITNICRKE
jgi:hypothetical protein